MMVARVKPKRYGPAGSPGATAPTAGCAKPWASRGGCTARGGSGHGSWASRSRVLRRTSSTGIRRGDGGGRGADGEVWRRRTRRSDNKEESFREDLIRN